MKALVILIVNAKSYFPLLFVSWGLSRICSWTFTNTKHEILIGVIEDTVPEKIEHHFTGMCAFDLLGFMVVCAASLSIQQKPKSKTIKEVLLAE